MRNLINSCLYQLACVKIGFIIYHFIYFLILFLSLLYAYCYWLEYGFFYNDFIYLFLERGEGKEKERERNMNVWLPLTHPTLGTWSTTQACSLTGNQTWDPLVRSPCSVYWATPARAICHFILCCITYPWC